MILWDADPGPGGCAAGDPEESAMYVSTSVSAERDTPLVKYDEDREMVHLHFRGTGLYVAVSPPEAQELVALLNGALVDARAHLAPVE